MMCLHAGEVTIESIHTYVSTEEKNDEEEHVTLFKQEGLLLPPTLG